MLKFGCCSSVGVLCKINPYSSVFALLRDRDLAGRRDGSHVLMILK